MKNQNRFNSKGEKDHKQKIKKTNIISIKFLLRVKDKIIN